MSWHTGIVAVRGKGIDIEGVANALGVEARSEEVSFLDATSLDATDCYLGKLGEWVIGANVMNWVWLLENDPDYLRGLAAKLPSADVFFFLMEGTSGTYGFGVATNGTVVRDAIVSEGTRVVDEGELTSWELEASKSGDSMEDDGETFAFALLASIVGPFDALEALTMSVHALA